MLAVLKGRDALAALPIGFGKSLIYQVPATMFERPTIVKSGPEMRGALATRPLGIADNETDMLIHKADANDAAQ
jgi:hypothetical protein